jgi:hypothetical protein
VYNPVVVQEDIGRKPGGPGIHESGEAHLILSCGTVFPAGKNVKSGTAGHKVAE